MRDRVPQVERRSGAVPRPTAGRAELLWLDRHMSSHGLIQEYEQGVSPNPEWRDGQRSYIYPNLLAILAYLDNGGVDRARRIADAMTKRQQPDGWWYTDYDYFTGRRMGGNRSHVGEAALMAMALFRVYRATNEKRYLRSANRASQWIKQFQMLDPKHKRRGSVTGGTDPSGKPYEWTSTEQNTSIACLWCYLGKEAYDTELLARARLVIDWLVRPVEKGGVWHAEEEYFHVGLRDASGVLSDFDEPSDCQSLPLLALDATRDLHGYDPAAYRGSLRWLLRHVKTVQHGDREVRGFSVKPLDKVDSIDVSIVQYYVRAAEVVGEKELARRFRKELDKLRNEQGLLPWMIAGDSALSWPYHMPQPHPITIAFDVMKTNHFVLDDALRKRWVSIESIREASRLLTAKPSRHPLDKARGRL